MRHTVTGASRRALRLCSFLLALFCATPALAQYDAAFRQVKFGVTSSTTPILMSGSGTPEGNVTAPPGSIYGRTDTGVLYVKNTGTGNTGWGSAASGTVTSVAQTVPSFLSVAGSPVTSSGTLAITLATQSANTLFAGPTTGSAAAPTFRAMVLADIPDGLVTLTKLNQSSCSTNDSIKWNGSAWVCLTGGASPLTTKGDLFGFSTVNARVAVGTDGQYLMADSSAATGVSWQTVAPGSGASASATYVTTASEAGLSAETTIGTIISTNAYASLPSAAVSGKLFFSNNSPYVLRDTGAAWAVWGPVFPLTIPNDAAFSWVNQGTATTTTTDGTVAFFVPKSTGTVLRGRVKTAPATPYTITAAFFPNWVYMNSGEHIGLIFRESGTSKMAQCETWVSATSPFASAVSGKFTNNTTYSADYVSRGNFVGNILWLQIGDDGTNRTCKISSDGKNWINLHSVARLDFLTGGADQVGWFAEEQTNTYDFTPVLLSWKEQ